MSRESRREHNEKRFREGNERLHDVVADQVPDDGLVPFLCECADDDCFGTVQVSLRDWEAVAAQEGDFLMIAGHQRSEGEQVVGSVQEYEIAHKPG